MRPSRAVCLHVLYEIDTFVMDHLLDMLTFIGAVVLFRQFFAFPDTQVWREGYGLDTICSGEGRFPGRKRETGINEENQP